MINMKTVSLRVLACLMILCMVGCHVSDPDLSTPEKQDETQTQHSLDFLNNGIGNILLDPSEPGEETPGSSTPTSESEKITPAGSEAEPSTPEETSPVITDPKPSSPEETTPEATEPPVIFQEVFEVVYATDTVNIRFAPSTNAAIFQKLYRGESITRTGISDDWSRIIIQDQTYYIASNYLTTQEPPADTLSGRVDQLLPQMTVSSQTDRLVLAVGNNDGSDQCTVFYFTKDSAGNWTKRFENSGFWGRNGVDKVIYEADQRTPVGCFPFRFAFGICENPGSVMEYKRATPTAYMVDDVKSKYYNQWVDTSDESIQVDWSSAEHVISCTQSYNYGIFIENNPSCDPTQGSSIICIHCTSPVGSSPGCINISEANMITLVKELNYDSRIVIVYGVEDLLEY